MAEYHYDKMLEINTAHNPSDNELNQLAKFMTKERKQIPAGYTYLGQFIDHDISLDSAAGIPPWKKIHLSNISNERIPFLNLETIYGFELPYNSDETLGFQLLKENSKSFLKLGNTKATQLVNKTFVGKDLPRFPNSPMAQIVDSRNDENLAVAQTQVAFMRFHNAVVKSLKVSDSTETFEEARKIVIQHYQWIILKDYLPRVIKESVLNDVLTKGNQFYFLDSKEPFIPLEFSFAVFRFGHSMVRNSYNWNRYFNDHQAPADAPLKKLAELTGRGGLETMNSLPSEWSINWNWFYELLDPPRAMFNFAEPITTKISSGLGLLPNSSGEFPLTFDRKTSLPAIDLYRGRALSLPSGQEVAKRIFGTDERILKPEQIAHLLPENLKYSFSKETPLWFYILAEAEIEEHGQTLGEIGSRIIAETFVKLIRLTKPTILNEREEFKPLVWKTNRAQQKVILYEEEKEKEKVKSDTKFLPHEKKFGMTQLMKFVKEIEKKDQDFDEFNPIGEF